MEIDPVNAIYFSPPWPTFFFQKILDTETERIG